MESGFAFEDGLNYLTRYFWLAEEGRAGVGVIEEAVHGYECFAVGQCGRGEWAVYGKASVKAECHECAGADCVHVRESTIVSVHWISSGDWV